MVEIPFGLTVREAIGVAEMHGGTDGECTCVVCRCVDFLAHGEQLSLCDLDGWP